jgi:hypothetical protein
MKIGLVAMLLAGCATTTTAPHGPTVTQVDRESRLCFDGGTLKVGQQVHVIRHVCAWVPPKNIVRTCHDERIEVAQVVRVLDDHCVIVAADAQGLIQPGDELDLSANP